MKKVFTTLCLSAILTTSMYAADFSRYTLTELQNMAGSVAPKDALDYRIEVHKRIENMTIKEARDFKEAMHNATMENHRKMTIEQLREYKAQVHEETQRQLENMIVKDAREKGVLGGALKPLPPHLRDAHGRTPPPPPHAGRGHGYGNPPPPPPPHR